MFALAVIRPMNRNRIRDPVTYSIAVLIQALYRVHFSANSIVFDFYVLQGIRCYCRGVVFIYRT